MKSAIRLLLLIFPIIALAQESRVASYYTERPTSYLGKKITVNCAYVKRSTEHAESVNFRACTATRRDGKSSFILVRVPKEKADTFAKKYGFALEYDNQGEVNTRPLSGILMEDNGVLLIDYTHST